jgi:phenylalanyl-tRNA synthetase beta chain
MIVSWNWLKQYVRLDIPVDELAHRLTMAGLNHESTADVAGDLAVDFEVTSNRPDCLGHIGVAREASAVLGRELTLPEITYATDGVSTEQLARVDVECPELCPRYTARVVRGVRIGPSPDWMRRRLATCGIAAINNVADVTNYVMFEIGQPLHAFDYDKLHEHRIVVRRARRGEAITAINQRRYELKPEMCVIADAQHAVAVAGVMGGFDSEISDRTVNVLVESASFDPLSIRRTSRALGLSSPSSYRFERGLDPNGVDWASRRCCMLISEVAGGTVAEGVVGPNPPVPPAPGIILRFDQIRRILGIAIDAEAVRQILLRLGLCELRRDATQIELRPPSWRRDLEREIDLIEEAGRIHGYHHIPEDTSVPMTSTARTTRERVLSLVRSTLVAAGFSEAYALSFVERPVLARFRPWCDAEPLVVSHPSRRQENALRQSLIPSLLACRRSNEAHGTLDSDLFEIARVYLPRAGERLPDEPLLVGLTSSRPLGDVRGAIEALWERLHVPGKLDTRPLHRPEFASGAATELLMGGQAIGVLGRISDALMAQFELRAPCVVAEMRFAAFEDLAQLIPRFQPVSLLPAISRELSLIVAEAVPWADIESTVRAAAGPYLESLRFLDLYRGRPIPDGHKSMHFDMTFRAADRTLTNEAVDRTQADIVAAAKAKLAAEIRGA